MKIAKGEYLGIYADKKLTFRQFSPKHLAYAQANKRPTSYGRDRVTIEHRLTPPFGERYLFHLTAAEVKRYKQSRLAVVKPSTVNKELNCLKAMLNKAVSWGYLKEHPLKGVKRLKEPPGPAPLSKSRGKRAAPRGLRHPDISAAHCRPGYAHGDATPGNPGPARE